MTTRRLAAAAGILGSMAAAATAQQTATYSFVFTTPGGTGPGTNNIIVAFDTVVTAKVFVSFSPGIGSTANGPGTLTGNVLGLSAGGFSISGAGAGIGAGWTGALPPAPGNLLVAPYNFQFGCSSGTAAGPNHNGVLWGMGFLLASVHPLPQNPALVWQNTFTTGATVGPINFSFTQLSRPAGRSRLKRCSRPRPAPEVPSTRASLPRALARCSPSALSRPRADAAADRAVSCLLLAA